MEPTDIVPEPECLFFNSGRCFRILVAEDIKENIMLAKIRLQEKGHWVIIARNGQEAVYAFQNEAIDIILMDVHMPEMDGLEAAQLIRELEAGSGNHMPIVALTASVMKDEQKRCLEAGMDAIAGKPVDFEELFDIMEQLVPKGMGKKQVYQNDSPHVPVSKLLTPGPLQGIDFKKGLSIWKNPEVYKKALLGFCRDYKNAADQMLNFIQTGDRESAFRIAHALKGVAGNLSVTDVFNIAAKLNVTIRDNPADELIPVIESLAAALNQSVDSICQLVDEPDKKPDFLKKSDFSALPQDLRELFKDLLNSFEEFNPSASEPFLEKLGQVLPLHQLDPIVQEIERFDFDRAKEKTVKLARDSGFKL